MRRPRGCEWVAGIESVVIEIKRNLAAKLVGAGFCKNFVGSSMLDEINRLDGTNGVLRRVLSANLSG